MFLEIQNKIVIFYSIYISTFMYYQRGCPPQNSWCFFLPHVWNTFNMSFSIAWLTSSVSALCSYAGCLGYLQHSSPEPHSDSSPSFSVCISAVYRKPERTNNCISFFLPSLEISLLVTFQSLVISASRRNDSASNSYRTSFGYTIIIKPKCTKSWPFCIRPGF